MPSLRGLKLAFSLLAFPSGIGVLAHQLTGKYASLMNFDHVFFLVKATQELYDSGIPKVPKWVEEAIEGILEEKKTQENGRNSSGSTTLTQTGSHTKNQQNEEQKPEIFEDKGPKKYWCRYFDYSGGQKHLIMQYDPHCTLYNIFDHKGEEISKLTQASSSDNSSSEEKNVVLDISQIVTKTSSLESKKIKNNSEFQKGGFYLLKLDKTRIPKANSAFNIEITVPGDGKRQSEKIYHKKITTVKIQAPLTGDPIDNVPFTFSTPLPSSRLIVKKVQGDSAQQAPTAQATSGNSQDDEVSYYFKKSDNASSDKLYIEHAWSFGKKPTGARAKRDASNQKISEKFDLSTLDKAPLDKEFTNGAQQSNSEEKHYLFKNVSDFWNYKVGEKIELYKSSKSKNKPAQNENTEKEEKLATFEIVSGALLNLSIPVSCIESEQQNGNNGWADFKKHLKENKDLIVKNQAKFDYCKVKNGLPEYMLILVGYSGDTQITRR